MPSPADLRAAIARDLRPARPLLPPSIRALMLVPIALATIVAVPATHFFRPDFAELGVVRAWGLSLAESLGGLVIVALALRESIPGRALPARVLALAFAGGLALPFVMLVLTTNRFTIGAPPGSEWSDAVICFRTSVVAAVPALIGSTVLVARAFPLRPGLAGALYGLGCGVMGDAGLRLFCDFSVPTHVIPAHGGAIVAATVGGAIAAAIIPRA